jgi:hypothetical protein
MKHPRSASRLAVTLLLPAAAAALVLLLPRGADAAINAGADIGIAKRSADDPANLKMGFAFQLHAEMGLLPFLNVGPYYTHYQLGMSSVDGASAAFNVIGLRVRAILPIPGSFKPFAYVGAGYTAVSYGMPAIGVTPETSRSGHFLETPIGIGLAYEVIPILHLSLEGAYRPGLMFGGDAFPDGQGGRPTSGWSAMIGAAINL